MNARIERLVAAAHASDIYPVQVKAEYDAFDENLSAPTPLRTRPNRSLTASWRR